ncbi:hypothetical protein VTJ04DRAFT_553 [Mycothermus thermophilus]|uniref:uncharacterized protein n=1 Tax=Humicola insolens TaxID=85995 RepID=UPI00374237C4
MYLPPMSRLASVAGTRVSRALMTLPPLLPQAREGPSGAVHKSCSSVACRCRCCSCFGPRFIQIILVKLLDPILALPRRTVLRLGAALTDSTQSGSELTDRHARHLATLLTRKSCRINHAFVASSSASSKTPKQPDGEGQLNHLRRLFPLSRLAPWQSPLRAPSCLISGPGRPTLPDFSPCCPLPPGPSPNISRPHDNYDDAVLSSAPDDNHNKNTICPVCLTPLSHRLVNDSSLNSTHPSCTRRTPTTGLLVAPFGHPLFSSSLDSTSPDSTRQPHIRLYRCYNDSFRSCSFGTTSPVVLTTSSSTRPLSILFSFPFERLRIFACFFVCFLALSPCAPVYRLYSLFITYRINPALPTPRLSGSPLSHRNLSYRLESPLLDQVTPDRR